MQNYIECLASDLGIDLKENIDELIVKENNDIELGMP